jgi:hypothetical protein
MANDLAAGQSDTTQKIIDGAQTAVAQTKRFVRRLFERKQAEALETESHTDRQLRPNVLSLAHLIAIGLGGTIGMMIGTLVLPL